MTAFDVCIIGSGAGGGPVAKTVVDAGFSVVVLEKGPWFTEKDYFKDEVSVIQRRRFTPNLHDEPHVVETAVDDKAPEKKWEAEATWKNGWDFWNGTVVGGATNFMSGFFHRLKPMDFHLLEEFGPIEGANVANWPISYEDLEPYYAKVEREVGVSGRVVDHPWSDARSTPDFPMGPTAEHPLAGRVDDACRELGLHPFPVPRCVLSAPRGDRRSCEYSGYCGSYGCTTGAKGSSRAALLDPAVKTGRCEVRPHAQVTRLDTDSDGRVSAARYIDRSGKEKFVDARIYVVACQAIETARLLLLSTSRKHPAGLANASGQVGKNLLFSAAASGKCDLPYASFPDEVARQLRSPAPFINRAVQDWYVLEKEPGFEGRVKGGTVDFLFRHPNPVSRARSIMDAGKTPLWGAELKRQLKQHFADERHVIFEVFMDWMPQDDCYVTVDDKERDRFGQRVARVRVGRHPHNKKMAEVIAPKAAQVLRQIGGQNVTTRETGGPATNLLAGTCRFGDDPATSVLDKNCRAHEVDNLFVTDGSFMPTGGSVPYTFTIYANSFRVADKIVGQLRGPKKR